MPQQHNLAMSQPSPHAPSSTRSASSPPVGRSPIGRDTTNAESHLHPSDHLAASDQGLNDTRVPPPIYLRGSSARGISNKGEIKIHLPQWRKTQVRPPRPFDNLSDQGIIRPPSEDTVVRGSLEIIMKEGGRAKAISVGVQSVCRLYLGLDRGWEEDGIFERGIEILGDREEGIWLEKGSQSFSFTIVLPGTLAVTANSTFGRVTHIVTARVEGGEAASYFSSLFSRKAFSPPSTPSKISNIGDFDRVIARSDELALRRFRSASTSRARSNSGPAMDGRTSRDSEGSDQGSAIVTAEGSPSVLGLYTRRPSFESSPARSPRQLPITPDGECPSPVFSPLNEEKSGWMKGDLTSYDGLIVFAVSPYTGDGMTLDVRKEGLVDGLGLWRFTAAADVFTVGSVLMLSVSIPSPSPKTTIFYTRFLLSEDYTITSPRTPNLPATRPESAQRHLLYQLGRPHKAGEKRPGRDVDALWRGAEAGGCPEEAGWKIKAMARVPGHMKIKPTTHERTITPLRISHDLIFQAYYSVDGEKVDGEPIDGPGELRVMQIKVPVIMSSCHCVKDALSLPTYETAQCAHRGDGPFFDIPLDLKMYCVCRSSFAELGEAAMRRSQGNEREEHEERPVEGSGDKAREDMANQGPN